MALSERFSPNTNEGCENIMLWSKRFGVGAIAVSGALLGLDVMLDFIPNAGAVAITVSSVLTAAECASIHSDVIKWSDQVTENGQQGLGQV